MNKKILFSLGLFLGLGKIAFAQEIEDLVRYSERFNQGTARTVAVGNAFGAVGADYGSVGINPAGLGLYRRPEFMFTLGYNQTSTNSNYLNHSAGDDAFNFNIGNVGLVVASPRMKQGKEVENGWVSVNWAVGMNRSNNYWSNTVVKGTNTKNSILNSWRDNANSYGLGPFDLGHGNGGSYGSYGSLAYNTYLIDPLSSDSTRYVDAARHDNKINASQTDNYSTSGSMNDINFTIAGNYSNQLYIGSTIAVPVVNFNSSRTYTEQNLNSPNGNDSQYRSTTLKEYLNTSGVGITANIGAIYRFSESFRAGLSIQLPTVYSLMDTFFRSINGANHSRSYYYSASNDYGFTYTLVTPARITASAALFFNKNGFVSADYEYTDYSMARVNSKDVSFFDLNQKARNNLIGVHNIRVGAEYRINQFAFRGGYNLVTSPYKSGLTLNDYGDTYSIFSLGAGFREKNISFDLTWQHLENKSTYTPYSLDDGTATSASVLTTRSNLMLTFATRF
jgi:hypothetical protein